MIRKAESSGHKAMDAVFRASAKALCVGEEMIEFLFLKARASGIKTLRVDSSLNAVNFYARNGFVEIGRGQFTTQSGAELDSIQMECKLSV